MIKRNFGKGIGPSALGNPCERAVWYKFRWADYTFIPKRVERLFQRGKNIEDMIVEELIEAGVPITSQQKKIQVAEGHITSYIDAIAENIPGVSSRPHIVEIKSANDKNFKLMAKNGLQVAQPEYYVQAQCYMFLHEMPNSLIIAYNKNDDNIHMERIKDDKFTGEEYLQHGVQIINQPEPGHRISEKLKYRCAWCDYKEICLENKHMLRNCRTCRYSEPIPGGKWHCNKHQHVIRKLYMIRGCSKYKVIQT